jgi:hypothetical protein
METGGSEGLWVDFRSDLDAQNINAYYSQVSILWYGTKEQ